MKAQGLNPRIRKSPFFSSSLKYGATEFHPYNGMWMPVGYDTPINVKSTGRFQPICCPEYREPKGSVSIDV